MSLSRALALLLPLALASAAIPHGGASNGAGTSEVVVAVLDTGARGTHSEFAPGQIVAWWDFGDAKGPIVHPGPGQTFDTRWPPYDDEGHGTATASRVGGKTVSLNPGVKLAIAKVDDGDGDLTHLEAAYDWAVNTVHADIVSISIGSIVPLPASFDTLDEAITAAMDKGVLTIVAAGNGMGNAGGPAVSWTHYPAYSKDAISVGSLFEGGGASVLLTGSSWQPDIAGEGWDVPIACPKSDACMERSSGTSFAAPHVAGGAAKLLASSITGGNDKGPRHLRQLVITCTSDNLWPYAIEGEGFFDADSVARGLPHAAAGTLCPYKRGPQSSAPATGITRADNDLEGQVARTGKLAMDAWLDGRIIVPVRPATTGPGRLGAGAPGGAFEVERYDVRLEPGQTLTASVRWSIDAITDVDLYLVPAGGPELGVYSTGVAVAASERPPSETESLGYTSLLGGDYTLLVVGQVVLLNTPIRVALSTGAFAGEDLATGHLVLGQTIL